MASRSMSSTPREGLWPKPGRSTSRTWKPCSASTFWRAKVAGPPPAPPCTPPCTMRSTGPDVPSRSAWIGNFAAFSSEMLGGAGHCATTDMDMVSSLRPDGDRRVGTASCSCPALVRSNCAQMSRIRSRF